MLKTTLSKIKKAWALALAARGRGDVRAYPSKFHKLSIAVLHAENPPDSEKEKLVQCEKCKRLIDYIFGQTTSIDGIKETKSDVTIPTYAYTQWKSSDKDEALIKATTSAITQEQLAQKIEDIDETTLVEAERKKIDFEHSKAPQKVLGHMAEVAIVDENNRLYEKQSGHSKPLEKENKEINVDMRQMIDTMVRRIEAAQLRKLGIAVDTRGDDPKSSVLKYAADDSAQNRKGGTTDENEQNSFDAIAKRCLDSPTGRIDEHLLKEMKKYGLPQGSTDNAMMQIGVIKKRKPVEKTEFEVESRKSENLPSPPNDKTRPAIEANISPQYHNMTDVNAALRTERTEFFRHDKDVTLEDAKNNQKEETHNAIVAEPRPVFNPEVPIIDPYDKKSLTFETDNFEYPRLTYFESNEEKAAREYAKKIAKNEHPFQIPGPLYYPGYGMSDQHSSFQNFDSQPHHWEESRKKPVEETDTGLSDQKTIVPEPSSETAERNNETQPEQSQQNNNNTPNWQQGQTDQPQRFGEYINYDPYYCHYQQNVYWNPHRDKQHIEFYEPKKYFFHEVISTEPEVQEQGMAPAEQSQDKLANSTATLNATPSDVTTESENKASLKSHATVEAPTTNPNETLSTAILNAKPDDKAPEENVTEPAPENEKQHTTVKQAATGASICSLPKPNEEIPDPPNEISQGSVQSNSTVCPLPEPEPVAEPEQKPPESEELPSLCPKGESLILSEMLRRVRLRNRLEFCKAKVMDPIEGKRCGQNKKPPCPPPAPKCVPCPPPCSPPQPPPCPRPCKQACPNPCPKTTPTCPPPTPTCPPPCTKFNPTCIGIAIRNINILLTLLLNVNPRPCRTLVPNMNTNYHSVNPPKQVKVKLNVISKLQNIGSSIMSQSCIEFGTRRSLSLNNIALVRDFEPWVPIPCWPVPKKEEKKRLVCPKEGCKVIPPPRLDAPCDKSGNPCLNFPKRRNFSLSDMLDYAKFAAYNM